MHKINNLRESATDYMTQEEKTWKNQIIKLLINKKHSKFAKRLLYYDLNIVEIQDDPEFTAAISTDVTKPVIYISRGFLTNPQTFDQLDVLLRHELSHNLMMHQLRMVNKLNASAKKVKGANSWKDLANSNSFQDFLNIIMDDEISNFRYSQIDKNTVRYMVLNGKTISGLVTEDHRQAWMKLSLEEMYEKSLQELEQVRQNVLNNIKNAAPKSMLDKSYFKNSSYARIDTPTSTFGTKDKSGAHGIEQIKKSKYYRSLGVKYRRTQIIINRILEVLKDKSDNQLKMALRKIGESKLTDKLYFGEILVDGKSEKIYITSPEQKSITASIIKYLLGNIAEKPVVDVQRKFHTQEYKNAYNEIMNNVKDIYKNLSSKDLEEILNRIAASNVIANKTSYGTLSKEDYEMRYGAI